MQGWIIKSLYQGKCENNQVKFLTKQNMKLLAKDLNLEIFLQIMLNKKNGVRNIKQ